MNPRVHISTNCLVWRTCYKLWWIWNTNWNQSVTNTSHRLVEDTSLHPWGILYESPFIFKDSFLVCIVTQRIKARKFLTHAANGRWESMRCTIWEIFGFNECKKVDLHFIKLSKDFFLTISLTNFFLFLGQTNKMFQNLSKNTTNSFAATLFNFFFLA